MLRSRLGLFLGLALLACGDAGSEDAAPPEMAAPIPQLLRYTTTDFAFEGPTQVEGGLVTVEIVNESETLHHVQLVRLPDGMSYEAFQAGIAEMQPGTPPPPGMVAAGGVNPPPPGEPSRATMMLEPGDYAVLCLVDVPGRVPHVAMGMMAPLTVTEPTSTPAELPPADLSLTLVDYAFSFSAPPTTETRVIRVVNEAEQDHEIAIFRLNDGVTMEGFGAWAEQMEGPLPFTSHGGVPAIRPGQVANFEVDLAPGNYVAICFVPDAGDGMPHVEHGMVLPFTIS